MQGGTRDTNLLAAIPAVVGLQVAKGTSQGREQQGEGVSLDLEGLGLRVRLRVRATTDRPLELVVQTGGPTHHLTATNLNIVGAMTGTEVFTAVCGLSEEGLPVFINPVTKGILARPREGGQFWYGGGAGPSWTGASQ